VRRLASIIIWASIIGLVFVWLPMMVLVRLFDRDPVRYKTGRLYRKLGLAISRVNPNWHVEIEGDTDVDHRLPYVMVSNHLSNADIPVISNLPWEMKWIAKKELFDMPVMGWMLKLAGDISVDRKADKRKRDTLEKCIYYLNQKCSVIFFPEGTRSRDGKLGSFAKGAFELAIREKKPILPIVLDGTQDCLPTKSWVFKPDVHIKLKVLKPVFTNQYTKENVEDLIQKVREMMLLQLSDWRNIPHSDIDRLAQQQS